MARASIMFSVPFRGIGLWDADTSDDFYVGAAKRFGSEFVARYRCLRIMAKVLGFSQKPREAKCLEPTDR